MPRFLLACPLPSQVGQTLGTVPAFAPVPRQVLHGPSPASRSDTVAPSMASLKVSDVSVSMSAPRRGRAWVVVVRPPKTPPSRSPSRPPVLPGWPPNRSPRSNPPNPPWPPAWPGIRTPPLPNSDLASSYSLRRFSSDSTLYASEISLKRSSDAGLPLLASGWYLRASLRYDFLISSGEASLATERTL